MTREIVAWTYQDDLETILIIEDEDEAMEAWWGQFDPSDPIPATVTLYGWARMEWGDDPQTVIQWLLDAWNDRNENMFDPDDGPDWTPEVTRAATELAHALLKMEPWACEVIDRKEVNVAEWIAKNHPEDAP